MNHLLTFDDSDGAHKYRIDSRPVPSVTQVLADLIPGWQAEEWYLQRGQAVHACAAMVARGLAFEHDPAIDGQVRAIRRFFAEVKPVVLAVEQQVYSVKSQYAGTLDLLCRKPGGMQLMLIDYKASLGRSVPYQLGGYAQAYEDQFGGTEINYGCGVEIRDDGTYKMSDIYDLRRYKAGFLALLSAHNIRRECGIKTEGEE